MYKVLFDIEELLADVWYDIFTNTEKKVCAPPCGIERMYTKNLDDIYLKTPFIGLGVDFILNEDKTRWAAKDTFFLINTEAFNWRMMTMFDHRLPPKLAKLYLKINVLAMSFVHIDFVNNFKPRQIEPDLDYDWIIDHYMAEWFKLDKSMYLYIKDAIAFVAQNYELNSREEILLTTIMRYNNLFFDKVTGDETKYLAKSELIAAKVVKGLTEEYEYDFK